MKNEKPLATVNTLLQIILDVMEIFGFSVDDY